MGPESKDLGDSVMPFVSRFATLTTVGVMLWSLGAGSNALAAVDEVVVVFKTHFDIGYTDLARNVVAR